MGLAALVGYTLPAAATARQFLDRFHDPAQLADWPQQGSFIPQESGWLAGLRAVVQRTVQAYLAAVKSGPTVTLGCECPLGRVVQA